VRRSPGPSAGATPEMAAVGHTGAMGIAMAAAVVTAMLGSGLLAGGSLLAWGGRLNRGRVGAHVWAATDALARRARRVGTAPVVAGSIGLGPGLWMATALS
jgi:hypothetical protein